MKRLFFIMAAVLLSAIAFAQENPLAKPVETDPEVRMGVLPNGLHYYIRHNERPKERCEFHIAQAVGAILEEDHQNGLAHFLEHMCFNGTEHFPGKGIINYFESVGVNFGGDINAYTLLDETVYRLSNVPTTRESILDSALLVLHDWSCAVSLLPEEIDNERGVIREEWRTRNTAQRRMWYQGFKRMLPGTQYAKRDVIGDTAVINNFSYQAIRDYYHKWYGPDLQAIIVVGDIDVDKMEKKIVDLFSPVPSRTGLTPRTRYGAKDNEQPDLGVYLDHEAQYQLIRVGYKYPAQSEEFKKSYQGYVMDMMLDLATSCINNRLSDLTCDPNANFTAMQMGYDNLAGETDAFQCLVMPKDGREMEAYRDLCREIERVRRYGVTETELERVKTENLAALEKAYNERNNQQNQSLAQGCIRYFLDKTGRSLTTPKFDWDIAKQFYPQITAQQLSQLVEQLISDKNMFIVACGKDKKNADGFGCDECNMPTEEQLLKTYQDAKNLTIEAPKEDKIDRPLVAKEPKAGKIVSQKSNEAMGTEELTLSNGIRVIIKNTDFRNDEIRMSAYSKGGYSKYPVADLENAQFAASIVGFNGVGTFSATELEKVLAGKQASVSPEIDQYSEEMSGSSSVKDFETMMQLNYLYFTAPRQDDQMYATLIGLLRNNLAARDANPKTEYSDRIQSTLYGNNPRVAPFTLKSLEQLNQKRALAIYKERFANPADFTFTFVGNINANDPKVRAILEKWLGGMKTSSKLEDYTDDHVYYAEGGNYTYFKRAMATKTASNRVYITAPVAERTLSNYLTADLIGSILGTRYLESIREREGGSYGVGTAGYVTRLPRPTMVLLMNFDTDPDKQNRLLGIIYDEVETIIKDGPLATDLSKEKENLLNKFDQNIRENGYWLNTILPQYYRYGINYVTDYKNTVNAIDAEAIRTTLKTLYEQNNRVEVVMMPTR